MNRRDIPRGGLSCLEIGTEQEEGKQVQFSWVGSGYRVGNIEPLIEVDNGYDDVLLAGVRAASCAA